MFTSLYLTINMKKSLLIIALILTVSLYAKVENITLERTNGLVTLGTTGSISELADELKKAGIDTECDNTLIPFGSDAYSKDYPTGVLTEKELKADDGEPAGDNGFAPYVLSFKKNNIYYSIRMVHPSITTDNYVVQGNGKAVRYDLGENEDTKTVTVVKSIDQKNI